MISQERRLNTTEFMISCEPAVSEYFDATRCAAREHEATIDVPPPPGKPLRPADLQLHDTSWDAGISLRRDDRPPLVHGLCRRLTFNDADFRRRCFNPEHQATSRCETPRAR
jgi:hypothetical protein